MSVDFQHIDDKRGVLISAVGDVLGKDLVAAMKIIFSEEDTIKKYKFGICDFSRIEKFDISKNEIFSLSKIHVKASKVNSNIIVGFAINKPVVYGLVGIWMISATMTGWKVHIEYDLPSIKNWVEKNLPAG